MKKRAFAVFFAVFFLAVLPCSSEGLRDTEGILGFLLRIEKTPPEIRIAANSVEKMFFWIPGVTKFLDEKTEEMEPDSFLKKYVSSPIVLVFENKRLVWVFAAPF